MNPEAYVIMSRTEAVHWWFKGRREIISHIISEMDLRPNASILEIGCGTGGNLEMLSQFGNVSGMEMNNNALATAKTYSKNRYDLRQGTCPDLSTFSKRTFDLICMFDVLEHIDLETETLREAAKLLTEDGRIILTVPAYQWLWGMHDEFLHHKRRYNASNLRIAADAAELGIRKLTYFNFLLFPIAAGTRIMEKLVGGKRPIGAEIPPTAINRALTWIFAAERFAVSRFHIPFGVSLLAILEPRR